MVNKNNAVKYLFLNAFLWGSSYVWAKMLLSFMPRFSILVVCSFVSMITTFVIFLPYVRTITRKDILPGLGISIISIISNIFFMFSLQYTSSSNAAFIVQLSVIITPILMAISERKLPQARIIMTSLTALIGLFLLICDFNTFKLNVGDLLALGNALFFSIYLTALNKSSSNVSPVNYTLIQHTSNTIIYLLLAGIFEISYIDIQAMKSPLLYVLLFANAFVTIVTILIQSFAIKYVRPDTAALIYTFEPITAMLLGFLLIGEKFNGLTQIFGCILIMLSVITALALPKFKLPGIKKEIIEELITE